MQHLQCLFPTETAALWDNIVFAATALPVKMGYGKVRVCVAMKAPVGLLSGRAVCVSRWKGFALTSSAERSKRLFTRGVIFSFSSGGGAG